MITNIGISRRRLLTLGGAGLAAAGLAPSVFATTQSKKRITLGIQLWSIRNDVSRDIDGALKWCADNGFEGVEFAGYKKYDKDPKGLKRKLDSLGLQAAGTHIPAKKFEGAELRKTIEFHDIIGCKLLIVPGDGRFSKPEPSKQYAELMNKAAKGLKPHGMFCGHHNHTREFDNAGDGKTYWDLFAERTSEDVVLQLDVGWTRRAKVDAVELIKRNPGRIKTTHIKPKPPKGQALAILGQDEFDWMRVFTACYKWGGTDWFNVEQEDYPNKWSPMVCAKKSLDGMKHMLKAMGK